MSHCPNGSFYEEKDTHLGRQGFCRKCQPPCITCTGIDTCLACTGCQGSRKCHSVCFVNKCLSDFVLKLIKNDYLQNFSIILFVLINLKQCLRLLIISSFFKRFSSLQKIQFVQRIQNSHHSTKENSTLENTDIPFWKNFWKKQNFLHLGCRSLMTSLSKGEVPKKLWQKTIIKMRDSGRQKNSKKLRDVICRRHLTNK